MKFKLVCRENIDTPHLEVWYPVLDETFKKFNNDVIDIFFYSEDDVLNWLESKSRTKSFSRFTNTQEFRNGDPNKLYAVYSCNHDNPHHGTEITDSYLYCLRFKKPSEAPDTFTNERGQRIHSSFKKINIPKEIKEHINSYSSNPREIKYEYYEGIYPLELDNDNISISYMNYVMKVHNSDTNIDDDTGYMMVTANTNHTSSWLDNFIEKLELVEKYLRFYSDGGNAISNLTKDNEQKEISNYILQILDDHKQDGIEAHDVHNKLKYIVIEPLLYNDEIYQIRHNKTYISWHKNYIDIIKKLKLIPSKTFADIIINFTLADFYRQIQSKFNLMKLVNNLEQLYNIKHEPNKRYVRFIGRNKISKPKFNTIVRSFKQF
jgi:hypothetical protein